MTTKKNTTKKTVRKRTTKKVAAKKTTTKKVADKKAEGEEAAPTDTVATATVPAVDAAADNKVETVPAPADPAPVDPAPVDNEPDVKPDSGKSSKAKSAGIMTPVLSRCINRNLATYFGVGKVPTKVSKKAVDAADAGFSALVVKKGGSYDVLVVEEKFEYNNVASDPVVDGAVVNLCRRAFEVGAYPRKG